RIHAGQREDRTTTTGTKAWELFADDTEVIAARVGADLKDLAYELQDGDEVAAVAIDSQDGLDILRHSAAHVMAQAVQELFPDAKLGIGPPIENGFYYDFDVATPFVPEDLEKIETRMRKIIKEGQRFSRRVTTDADAIDELQDEPYKLELIGLKGSGISDDAAEGASVEVGAGELTIYDNVRRNGDVAWSDLCRGPHLPTTKRIPAFKLMRSAAAYWRGDEKNKQLQRIYGTAWPSKEELEGHLHRLELRSPTLGESGIGLVERMFNRGGWEVAGGNAVVDASGWDAAEGYAVVWAPSVRMVMSLADFDDSRWVNLTGVSGHPFSEHYTDQTDVWAEGGTLPWRFERDAVVDAGADTLTLVPADPDGD
ncbi:penicillin acylase family protein, partial [Sphingomonas sp. PB1R3]